MSTQLIKVAWVRDRGYPPGKPAPGRLNCPCGNAPESEYHRGAPDVICECGTRYTFDGWITDKDADKRPPFIG